MDQVFPAFKDKNIVVCFASSNEFLPFLCVALSSLVEHSVPLYNYDILILSKDITLENKNILKKSYSRKNVSVRFVDSGDLLGGAQPYHNAYLSTVTYYRLQVPVALCEYDKVLFLDSDILVLKDVAELYNTELGSYPLAASRCVMMNAIRRYSGEVENYLRTEIGLSCTNAYFQGGVLLINVKEWLQKSYSRKLLDLAVNNNLRNADQDVMNKFFKDNYLEISNEWNYETSQMCFRPFLKCMDKETMVRRSKVRNNPFLIHFSGKDKPWRYPHEEFANVWWHYARETPFYEAVIARLIDFRVSAKLPHAAGRDLQQLRDEFKIIHFPSINCHFAEIEKNMRLLYVIEHPMMLKFRKWRYAVRKAFSSGKERKKYQQKYDAIKNLLEEAKGLKKVLRRV